jgi:hypothetical protein
MAESAYSGSARRTISQHIKKHKKEGMGQKRAVAAAMSEARRKGQKAPPKRKGSKGKSRGGSKAQHAKAGRKGGKAKARKSKSS